MQSKSVEQKRKLMQQIKDIQSINALATQFAPGTFMTGIGDDKQFADYNSATGEIVIRIEVQGTQYEGRSPRIEPLKIEDSVRVEREPNNSYNFNNLAVLNAHGESLGNLPADLCDCVSPLLDAGELDLIYAKVSYVEPLSHRGSRAKKAILYIEIGMNLKKIEVDSTEGCVICILGGDQIRRWAQKLIIHRCNIPICHAKLLFELYNRMCGEYESIQKNEQNFTYVGLDNLVEEIVYARKKMKCEQIEGLNYAREEEAETFAEYLLRMSEKEPERYGELMKYVDKEATYDYFESGIANIFSNFSVDSEEYYWLDQTRVSTSEWDCETVDGFNHWYEIMELYDGTQKLPFDLSDEDVVSILGFGQFEAFADLSYGC